ncbi:MAG: MG2 domain-containing protein [Leptospira sp.]|nr:MG2 domain-containing protein [Leptospira sp.]
MRYKHYIIVSTSIIFTIGFITFAMTSQLLRKAKRSLFPSDCRITITFDTSSLKYYEDRWDYNFQTSEKVEIKEFVRAIEFSPNTSFNNYYSLENNSSYSSFSLNQWEIQPETNYNIKVGKFYSENDCIYDASQTFSIPALQRKPNFWAERESVFESNLTKVLPISISNVKEFKVRYSLINASNVVQAVGQLGNKYYTYNNGINWKNAKWKTGEKANNRGEQGIDLDSYFGGSQKKGFLALELSADVIDDNNKQVLKVESFILQSTNLGITAKKDNKSIHVWVNTLNKAQPVNSSSISLFHRGEQMGNCKTEKDGHCVIQFSGSIEPNRSILVADAEGTDSAFLYLGESELYSYDYDSNTALVQGKIYFDRKLYRPGDKVEVKAFIGEKKNGHFSSFESKSVQVAVRDSKGKEVYSKSIISSYQGGVAFTYPISKDSPLGHYTVSLTSPGATYQFSSDTFQVEEFRPVNFAVDVEVPKQLSKKDKLKAKIIGKYLFGAPMTGAKVKYSILKKQKSIYFQDHSDYSFGNSFYYDDYYQDNTEDSSGYLSGEESELNAKGEYLVDTKIENIESKFTTSDSDISIVDPYTLLLEASVLDIDGKSVTKTESVSYLPSDSFVGLKCQDRYQGMEQPFKFGILTVDKDGKAVTGKDLKVHVIYNDWSSVLSKGIGKLLFRSNSLEKKIVETKKIVSGTNSNFEFKAKDSGSYTLVVTNSDGMYSRIDFYAYKKETYYAWDFRSDDSIELKSDKKDYKIGDTAKILIKSPLADARLLVAVERDEIYETYTYQLKGNSLPLEIPIKGEYLPNVTVSVVLLSGRQSLPKDSSESDATEFKDNDLGAPKSKSGKIVLKVDTSSKIAPLTIKTDKEEYGPRDLVKLTIKTHPGSEVAVSVADRGVLDLVGYRFTNPVSTFYNLWANIVKTYEMRNLIIKHYAYQNKGDSPGGDYGDEGGGGFGFDSEDGTRKDFRYTAFWNPALIADSVGEVEIQFNLPDNLTTFRIMVASSYNGTYGVENKEFRVKKSLVLQKIASRFVRIGDELELGVSATNNTKKNSKFKINVKSDFLVSSTTNTDTIDLNAGQTKEYTKKVKLSKEQYIKLREKQSDGEISVDYIVNAEPLSYADFSDLKKNDISDSLKVSIPIKELDMVSVAKASGFTDSNYKYLVKFPSADQILGNRGQIRTSLSATALQGLRNAFDFYESNPYFCMEQRTSAYLLSISSGSLLKDFKYAPPNKDSYDFANIEKLFLDEMNDFQYADGSFGLWKEKYGRSGYPYLTAYVLETMQLAKERNLRINNSVIAPAIRYLEDYIKNPSDSKDESWQNLAKIYSVLVKEKRNTSSLEKSLSDNFQDLNAKSQGTFLLALAEAKGISSKNSDPSFKKMYDQYAKKFIWENDQTIKVIQENENRFWYSYYSHASALAIYLRLQIKVDSDNKKIPSLVQLLLLEKAISYWNDSHSAGTLAFALREYHDKFEIGSTETSASVFFGESNLFNGSFAQDSNALTTENFSLDRLFGKRPPSNTEMKFQRTSDGGRLYFSSSFNYVPIDESLKSYSNGIKIEKTVSKVVGRSDSEEPILEEVSGKLDRGQTYYVKLTIESDDDRAFLMVVDPIPSNTEIVNTSFLTEKSYNEESDEGSSDGDYSDYDYYDGNSFTEFRDDRALFSKDRLRKGETEFHYYLRPLVKGVSLLPAAKAFLMYQSSFRTNNATSRMKVE